MNNETNDNWSDEDGNYSPPDIFIGNKKASPEQSEIFRVIDTEPTQSLLIRASAGSGKTTTIVEAASRLPVSHMQCFLAFNKSIQLELADRLPRQCSATTFHSLGNTSIRNSGRRPKVSADKSKWLVKPLLRGKESSVYWTPACKLISYAKNAGIGPLVPDTVDAWLGLIETFSLEFSGDDRRLVEISRAAYLLGNNSDSIDFDDMLYWPLVHDLPFDKTSTVFVDEAQDTNIVQRALLRKMLFPNGRVIAVGDPSQAIYGFRGASADALTRLKEDFSMTVLPLSVSYRCSQAVVKEAQKFDKGII